MRTIFFFGGVASVGTRHLIGQIARNRAFNVSPSRLMTKRPVTKPEHHDRSTIAAFRLPRRTATATSLRNRDIPLPPPPTTAAASNPICSSMRRANAQQYLHIEDGISLPKLGVITCLQGVSYFNEVFPRPHFNRDSTEPIKTRDCLVQ